MPRARSLCAATPRHGDQPHPVQTAEVTVDKRVARLRLLDRALGEADMPGGVLLPGVRLQERVLLRCARLHVLPTRPEHVLARVDQPLRVPDRVLVQRVGGHARIFADPRVSDCLGTAAWRSGSRRPPDADEPTGIKGHKSGWRSAAARSKLTSITRGHAWGKRGQLHRWNSRSRRPYNSCKRAKVSSIADPNMDREGVAECTPEVPRRGPYSLASQRKPCKCAKADARTRTGDPFITSEVLYQLSYVGSVPRVAASPPLRLPRLSTGP